MDSFITNGIVISSFRIVRNYWEILSGVFISWDILDIIEILKLFNYFY